MDEIEVYLLACRMRLQFFQVILTHQTDDLFIPRLMGYHRAKTFVLAKTSGAGVL